MDSASSYNLSEDMDKCTLLSGNESEHDMTSRIKGHGLHRKKFVIENDDMYSEIETNLDAS